MKELQPLHQNVLLDYVEEKQMTAGGIYIPDTAKEKPKTASVLATGNIEDSEIAPGDVVIFKQYAGTEIEFEGRKYLLIPYADIIAKIVETEKI